jgi:hypothetical protein
MVHTDLQQVVQFAGAVQTGQTVSASVTLPAPGSGPVAIGGVIHRQGLPFIAGPGFMLVGQDGCAPPSTASVVCVQAEGRDDFVQTGTLAWTNMAHWILIGVEVQ